MKLQTYWTIWYLATDGVWHRVTNELGNISSMYFGDLALAERDARRLTECKDIVEIEVREERSVLSFCGAAKLDCES